MNIVHDIKMYGKNFFFFSMQALRLTTQAGEAITVKREKWAPFKKCKTRSPNISCAYTRAYEHINILKILK